MALAPLDEVELAFLRELRGRGVRFVVILASKRALGRPKDLAQIPVLEAAIAVRDERARED